MFHVVMGVLFPASLVKCENKIKIKDNDYISLTFGQGIEHFSFTCCCVERCLFFVNLPLQCCRAAYCNQWQRSY